jgi:tetratricopeptide (TPR) repeat protein
MLNDTLPKARRKPSNAPRKQGANPNERLAPAGKSRTDLWICLALFVATFFAYAQVEHFAFVNYDDNSDVSDNVHVRPGVTTDSVAWALTSGQDANWIPLTRLSHILDAQLSGLQSGFHHLTNVLFHALAVLLLFAFLNRATRARWPSAFAALLFAWHPLHVESVAWIAERKDVLSAFFWFLALWAYVRYAERPAASRYAIVLVAFCLGLMAKPMVVTLPFVLFLLDVWPLRRLSLMPLKVSDREPRITPIPWSQALLEKVPFFLLSAAAAVVTYFVQKHGGAVKALTTFPIGLRTENVLVSYVTYLIKTFWPTGLAVFYPYPASLPVWEVALSALAILGISALVLRWFRDYPYLTVGWLWYLGTLVPVIGLVQVGDQARADRYMYIPMAGLAMMLAWGASDALARWPQSKRKIVALAATACLAILALTMVQLQYWQNSQTLFEHALNVTEGNYLAHTSLGVYLLDYPERLQDAIGHFEAAVRIKPDYDKAQNNLGLALSKIPDRMPEAIPHLERALQISPDYAEAHNNLAAALLRTPGGLPKAIKHLEAAVRSNPGSAEMNYNLGVALSYVPERLPESIAHLETALRISPDFDTQYYLGLVLSRNPGTLPEAIQHFEGALQFKPGSAEAHYNLGLALSQVRGGSPQAASHFEAALRIRPDFQEARQMLGRLRAPEGQLSR